MSFSEGISPDVGNIISELNDDEAEIINFQLIEPAPRSAATAHAGSSQMEDLQFQRFHKITPEDVEFFLINQQNANTMKKTNQDMSVFKMFLHGEGENRSPELIPPYEMNKLICTFLLAVRKKDGGEYEPTTLRGFISSIDRYLKMKSYPVSIISDIQFRKSQDVLKMKQKQLKSMGKGNKPRAADCVTDAQLEQFYQCNALGSNNPSSLIHSMWAICTINFGMRPGRETHDLMWGDINLKMDDKNNTEYLEYTQERQTKTRTGVNPRDIRQVKPRAYAMSNDPEKDPVRLYKLYADKRPEGMNMPDSPFFLTVNTAVNLDDSSKSWYKKKAMGINKMYKMMQEIKEMSGMKTDQHLTNHSMRKHLIQKLSDSGIPPNQIVQISGHKNVNSINNYSKINPGQSKNISHILSSTKPTTVPSSSATRPTAELGQSADRSEQGLMQHKYYENNSSEGKNRKETQLPYQGLFSGNSTFNAPVHIHFHGQQVQHHTENIASSQAQYNVIRDRVLSPASSPVPEKTYKRIRLIPESDSD